MYDGTNKGFFKWVKRLEAACLQSERDIHTQVLGKAGGDIRTLPYGPPSECTLELSVTEVQEMLL